MQDYSIIEEVDYNFLKYHLRHYKNIRVKINSMLKKGELVRVKKGLYVFGEKYARELYLRESLANKIYGPSYISLEYALSFWGIIPEKVNVLTSITNKKNKEFNTPVGTFTYRHINSKLYSEGITLYKVDDKHNILIATKEKAIADMLHFADKMHTIDELKLYLFENLRTDESVITELKRSNVTKLSKIYGNNVLLLEKLMRSMN